MIDFKRDGTYLIKPEHHDPKLIEFTPADSTVGLKPLQEAVEGYIEHVHLASEGFTRVEGGPFGFSFQAQGTSADAYVNEEGKVYGMAVNMLATELVRTCGFIDDVIVGNMVVVCGAAREREGDE